MATDNLLIGTDFSGVDDIDFSLTEVNGRRALAEAVARRWLTDPGGLVYAADYGAGLGAALLSDVDPALAGKLEQEALKDERVENVQVRVSLVGSELQIIGRLVDAAGPFTMTVDFTGLKAALTLEGG